MALLSTTAPGADVVVPGTVLLSGVVGSTAYGLAVEGSDVDRLGIFAFPTSVLHGLATPKESVVTTKPDAAFHEARKASRLLLKCNPTMNDILWLPRYEVKTALGDELVGIRDAFLSAKYVRDAHLGYAADQCRKLLSRGDGSFSADTRKRTAKHARHLARLVDFGYELYTTGRLTVQVADPKRYHDFGEAVVADPQVAATFMADAETRFDRARCVLPECPSEPIVQAWLYRVRHHFYTAATAS